MHIGENDVVIPRETMESIKKNHADTPLYTYSGAPHGFDNETRQGYDQATAKLARVRTLQFFSGYLS